MNDSSRGPARVSPILPRLLMHDQRIGSRGVVESRATSASVAAALPMAPSASTVFSRISGSFSVARAVESGATAGSRLPTLRASSAATADVAVGVAEEQEQRLRGARVGGRLERAGDGLAHGGGRVGGGAEHGGLGFRRRDAAEEADGVDAERVARGRDAPEHGGNGGLAAVLGQRGELPEGGGDHFGEIGVERLLEDLELILGLRRERARGGA